MQLIQILRVYENGNIEFLGKKDYKVGIFLICITLLGLMGFLGVSSLLPHIAFENENQLRAVSHKPIFLFFMEVEYFLIAEPLGPFITETFKVYEL